MPNNRTRLPLPDPVGIVWSDCRPHHTYSATQLRAYSDAECAPLMEEIDALRQDGSKLTAENAALRERLLKMSDTMKGMDAHEAGLAEAQAYLMERVKVLEDALHLVLGCAGDIQSATDAELESALSCGDPDTEKQANAWLVARAALEAK